ncbi:MAG: hypothetical protein JWL84_3628 [Rhodospirillales bacterium]|jgi:hypothetical protein|nr:hypothetical protein [Rhodospirillales bacterium]
MKPIIAFVATTMLLAACTQPPEPPAEQFVLDWSRAPPEPPLPVNYPPDAFAVRWSAADPVIDPKIAAERHCQAWDGHAELVAEYASGNEFAAEFVCKGVPKHWWTF